MRGKNRYQRAGIALALLLLAAAGAHTAPSREQVAYWQQYYGKASPNDPCVARARTVFERIVQAAGTPPGRVPSLLITQQEPGRGPLALALPHGWIVLSKGVLERLLGPCAQPSASGEARLAFVLGHELAHHLQEDFWHLRLFTALDGAEASSLRQLAAGDRPEHELQADVRGITYAAMAGFDTQTIVADDPAVNFFQEWTQARVETHPTPQQRAETVKARLRQVLAEIELFQAGLLFYYAGHYEKAIPAFEAFRHVFDGREVYHNLATSHHQLALQIDGLRPEAPQRLPFRLSVAVDPETRARRVRLMRHESRSADGLDARLRHHLDSAVTFYHAALARDPAYTPAANNLGAALTVRGVLYAAPADLHAAAATLLQVPTSPGSAATLNNLGVAYWHLGDGERALTSWRAAHQLAPAYAPALFNLGEQAYRARRAEEAQQYWRHYVQVEPLSVYTTHLLQRMPAVGPSPPPASPGPRHAEHVQGVRVGDFEGDRVQGWGTPQQRPLSLSGDVFTASQYPHQVWTLSQGQSLHLILVQAGYTGASAGGIAIGATADAVRQRYGEPSRIQEMPQGHSWCYDARGIAFQLHQGRVIAWLLYDA